MKLRVGAQSVQAAWHCDGGATAVMEFEMERLDVAGVFLLDRLDLVRAALCNSFSSADKNKKKTKRKARFESVAPQPS
jgi:hypothetical protein